MSVPDAQSAPNPMLYINGHNIGGGFKEMWLSTPKRYQAFGDPISEEMQAMVTDISPDGIDEHDVTRQRTVQFFERAIFIYQPEEVEDWKVVCALATQQISVNGG